MNQTTENIDTLTGIAIIGMAGRFPGAKNIDTFWNNLKNGLETISFFTDEELLAAGLPLTTLQNPNYVKARGYLEDTDCFDAAFFGYSPREAELMDPQHRLFLETTYHALEHAGYDSQRYTGWIGVFGGASDNHYLHYLLSQSADPLQTMQDTHVFFGNYRDFMITRTSYKLNLTGPAINIQTACSTSLVATNLACQSLLNYECDLAVAGGVSVHIPSKSGYLYETGGIPSPDGHCRTFDAQAQGTVSGDGVTLIVLKRLEEALADGDTIYAIIKGFATNNDGTDKIGYTAPGVNGQTTVIALAHQMAGGNLDNVSYIEAHGTATPLGDPVEIKALTQAFRQHTQRTGFCRIGSVKSNVGHLDAAAGVTGLIKIVLALQHELIPPTLHFQHPNPQIDFAHSPFLVNAQLTPWPRGTQPRRAGVSSFGIGGTNAHIVLEEAPAHSPSSPSRPYQLFLFSAKTASALEDITAHLQHHLQQHPQINWADAAYTLQIGRGQFEHRRYILCQDLASLLHPHPTNTGTHLKKPAPPEVIFMFTGQGAQYVNMGQGLYQHEPLFREPFDHCAKLLKPILNVDLCTLLYPTLEQQTAAQQHIHHTAFAQPLLFSLEYALANLLIAWGIQPKAMIGHSIGEYVAACLAGVFSLTDALTLIAHRSRLMQTLPTGAMLSITWSITELTPFLKTQPYAHLISIAAINAPLSIVAAGPIDSIEQLQTDLQIQAIPTRRLHTSHAFHSHMMEGCLNALATVFKTITLHAPQRPFISNLTGTWIQPEQATDPHYWLNHLRHTVQFSQGLITLLNSFPNQIYLEIGPGITLSSLLRKHLTPSSHEIVLSTLPAPQNPQSDQEIILNTLGQLWLSGLEINWATYYQHEQRHRISLPGYPFTPTRHWAKLQKSSTPSQTSSDFKNLNNENIAEITALVPPPKQDDLTNWFYAPQWQRILPPIPTSPTDQSRWLLLMDDCGIGQQLINELHHYGQFPIQITAGDRYQILSDHAYTLRPQHPEDYLNLLQHLTILPNRIVYLWGITRNCGTTTTAYQHYNQLLYLIQALGTHHPVPSTSKIETGTLQLTLVTNQMQAVLPNEAPCPAKAVLLGLCKTIPLEYPQFSCRSIDLPITLDIPAAQLLQELIAPGPQALLTAYRHQHRWIQNYPATPLLAPLSIPRLKEKGTYLIIGGLGGVGLALADHLAYHCQANIALVGRSHFPLKSTWEHWLKEGLSSALEHWAPALLAEEQRLWENTTIRGIPDHPNLSAQLLELCYSYAYDYLKSPLGTASSITLSALKNTLHIQPKFEKFIDFMVQYLAEHHRVEISAHSHPHPLITFLEAPRSPTDLLTDLHAQFPEFRGLYTLLEHCAAHYSPALSGAIPAISVLYPDGKSDFLNACEQDTIPHSYEPIYRNLLRHLLEKLVEIHPQGRPLRILEVGAGQGLLTWELIPSLEGKAVEYHFSDLGPSFIKQAQHKAQTQGFNCLRFQILDIAKNPLDQGFEQESFDIILGMNVVHATPHLEETLFHLQTLLAPQGLLGLIETTQSYPWVDMAWGLTEGWWYFKDYPLRSQSPLLSLEQWESFLKTQPFDTIKIYPNAPEIRFKSDVGLILAQKRARSQRWLPAAEFSEMGHLQRIRAQILKLQALERQGAEIAVYQADVADQAQLSSVLAAVHDRFGPLNGVIHAALVLKDGMIQFKDPQSARQVLAPKITGTEVLYELVKSQPLDFLVLCSSLASIIGTYAQSDYCAANAYQDAFAHQKRHQDQFPIWSINWGIWQDTGAAMRLLMSKTAAASRPQWVSHPLFDYRLVFATQILYYGRLQIAKDWILKEHRLNQQAVLAGTVYLELARAAFQHHTQQSTLELHDVYFLKPLVVPEGAEIEFVTLLEPMVDKSGFQFTVLSGDHIEHATGTLLPGPAVPSQTHNIELLKHHCPQFLITSSNHTSSEMDLTPVGPVAVGPRWTQAIQSIQLGQHQALAFLSLPTCYQDDLLHYHCHPALLDMATSFALGQGDFYLPLAYQKISYYQALPANFYAYARYLEDSTSGQETLSYDLILLTETGQECLSITGFTLRKVDTAHLSLDTFPVTQLDMSRRVIPSFNPELQEGMTSEEGAQAFIRILSQDAPQIAVSTQELTAVLKRNQTQSILRNKTEHLQSFQVVAQQIEQRQTQVPKPQSTDFSHHWEFILTSIWQEVLGVPMLTAEDNFFELGGDSLLAIMVTTRLKNALHLEVSPTLLFKAPSITLLIQELEKLQTKEKSLALPLQPVETVSETAHTINMLPLTFGQQRMWYLATQLPQDDVYIIPSVYKIVGPLQIQALKSSLTALIERHDALRTTFIRQHNLVKQVINKHQTLALTEINLLELPPSEKLSKLQQLLSQQVQQPFHLLEHLPWRFLLIQVAADEFILSLVFHNLIIDGWSFGLLNQELALLYNAFSSHQPSPLPQLSTYYADYTRWQQQHFQGATLATTVSYWQQRLTTLPATSLPYDHSPETVPNLYRGKVINLHLPTLLANQLKIFNTKQHSTLFITLLTTFTLLLRNNLSQDHITVWSPFANRHRQDLENVAGLFVNALPIDLDCSGYPSFIELVQRCQSTLLELTQHSHFPFTVLQEQCDFVPNNLSRVEFVVHNYSFELMKLNELTVTPLPMDIDSTAFDLELHLWELNRSGFSEPVPDEESGIAGQLFYNTAFFEHATIQQLIQNFYQLLGTVLTHPEHPV